MSNFNFNKILLPVKRYWERWVKAREQLSPKERRRQNLFIGVCTVCGILFIVCLFNIIQSSYQLNQLKKEEVAVEKQHSKLQTSESKLKHEVSMLKDSSYIEKLARSRYFLSKPGEQIYVFPEESDTSDEHISQSLDSSTLSETQEMSSTVTAESMSTTQSR